MIRPITGIPWCDRFPICVNFYWNISRGTSHQGNDQGIEAIASVISLGLLMISVEFRRGTAGALYSVFS